MISEVVVKSELTHYGIEMDPAGIQDVIQRIDNSSFSTGRIDQALAWIDQKGDVQDLLAKLVNLTMLKESGAEVQNPQRTEIGLSHIEYLVATRSPDLKPEERTEILNQSGFRYLTNATMDRFGRELPIEKLYPSKAYHLALVFCAKYEAYDAQESLVSAKNWLGTARANGLHPNADIGDFSLHEQVVRADVLEAQLLVYEAKLNGSDELLNRAIEIAGIHETSHSYDLFVAGRMYKALGEACLLLALKDKTSLKDNVGLEKAVGYLEDAAVTLPDGTPMKEEVLRLQKVADGYVNQRVVDNS